ncbi:MAG: YdcF family protein [Clostridia bacterium]|nr:YdcF family protein [Clostridia bacterium]
MNLIFEIILKFFGVLLLILGFLMAIYLPFVISDAKKGYRDNCEYLLILGSVIIGANTPSPQLITRMKYAVDYLKENQSCFVVPCGGCFRKGQKVSESQVISDYLIDHGIDQSRIIQENKSTTTFENFINAKKIIQSHSGKDINNIKVAFLSSSYHMHRGALIAKRCGIKHPLRVSCPTEENILFHYIREFFVAFELLNFSLGKQ